MAEDAPGRDPWLPDDPITDDAQDTLGRGQFARRVADIVNDAANTPSSVVVGLTGPWGSGKSGTANLAVAHLDRQRWTIRDVNPWGLTGAEAVVTEVLAAISSALPGRRAKKAREAIGKYATLASPLLSALPIGGDLAGKVLDLAASRLAGNTTLTGQARHVADALEELTQPILIVIDDMDRLQPPELLALFKAVRLLGRLPHVHYLLSYDQRTVLELIAATPIAQGKLDRAAAFMEKIVTIRMDQPPTRIEQAETLYDARMRDLLTRLKISGLTQNEQQRIATEHRQLLRRTLTEPRIIGRFFTQLYAYLPLLGVDDVDLPDFIGMTLLRLQFPRLYGALSEDRRLLVGATIAAWEEPIGNWRDLSAHVDALSDAPALRAPIEETVTLLFPRLSRDYTSTPADDQVRKRAHRTSDEDYVDRYFALTLPDDDISDTYIAAGLTEWAHHSPGDHVQTLQRKLLANERTAASYAATDRILRRCGSASSILAPDDCVPVAVAVSELFRDLPQANLAAAQNWLTTLLSRSTPIPLDALLRAVTTPAQEQSALWPLIQAMTDAALSQRSETDGEPESWLSVSARKLGDNAWTRFVEHVGLGDTAPAEPALGYLLHAEKIFGRDDTDTRLRNAVDSERIRTVDLAARLVNIGSYLNDYREFITEFEPADLVTRIGSGRIDEAQIDIEHACAEVADAPIDTYDISWPNLRRIAARRLATNRPDDASIPSQLTQAADDIVNEVTNRTAPAITNANAPELLFTITVWAPTASINREPLSDTDFDAASNEWVSRLGTQRTTAWLTDQADAWHTNAPAWRKTESDGQRSQQAQADLVQPSTTRAHPTDETANGHLIAAIAARVDFSPYPGNAGQRFTRLLTLEAGFWLGNLDIERRHTTAASTDRPLPAALRLAQARQLLTMLTADAMNQHLRHAALDTDDFDLILVATVNTTNGIDAVLDLAAADRETIRASNQADFVVDTPARDTYSDRQWRATVDPDRLAVTVLTRWLRANGYRNYRHLLDDTATP